MRYKLTLLLTALTISAFAQKKTDRTEILNVLEQQRLSWNKGDLQGYMQGYWQNDSLLFVGKSGPTYGWKQTLSNYQRSYPDKARMGQLTFGINKVNFLTNNKVFVLGSWKLHREKDELQGYFTLIFHRINGFWLIVVDHSS